MSFKKSVGPCSLAVLIGAGIAPISVGISLELIPLLGPALLYGLIAFVFGLISPGRSWRWGIWITLGIPMVIVLLPIADLVNFSIGQRSGTPFSFGFLWVTLVFGFLPGLAGGCVGGYLGAAAGRLWKARVGEGGVG
jgi:hypothetical protein